MNLLKKHGQIAKWMIEVIGKKLFPYTTQGQFLFEDSFGGDGGFYCIPKSHLRFDEFAQPLEIINDLQIPWSVKSKVRDVFINEFFDDHTDDSDNNNFIKHITALRG